MIERIIKISRQANKSIILTKCKGIMQNYLNRINNFTTVLVFNSTKVDQLDLHYSMVIITTVN